MSNLTRGRINLMGEPNIYANLALPLQGGDPSASVQFSPGWQRAPGLSFTTDQIRNALAQRLAMGDGGGAAPPVQPSAGPPPAAMGPQVTPPPPAPAPIAPQYGIPFVPGDLFKTQ
jgi:hypothetical protein